MVYKPRPSGPLKSFFLKEIHALGLRSPESFIFIREDGKRYTGHYSYSTAENREKNKALVEVYSEVFNFGPIFSDIKIRKTLINKHFPHLSCSSERGT